MRVPFYHLKIRYTITMEKKNSQKIREEVWTQAIGYIVGAFGLVAGLAWNDAVQSLIKTLIPVDANSVWIKFIYAIGITIVVVGVTLWLRRLSKKDGE